MGNRKDYWNNNYYEYWKSRVEEAKTGTGKSGVVTNDAKTEDDSVYIEVFNNYPFKKGNVLDVGCAWGRMFEIYLDYGLEVYGVDISSVMVREAAKAFAKRGKVKEVKESEAEALPFEDNFFDNVTCLATFDATFQHEALSEFFRVLKPQGRLYLTGKSSDYHLDDEIALAAEIGARGKGHPNYFTDIPNMLNQLKERSHKVVATMYFERRGDFAEYKYKSKRPDNFYEWFFIVDKGSADTGFTPFSDVYSKTYLRTYNK